MGKRAHHRAHHRAAEHDHQTHIAAVRASYNGHYARYLHIIINTALLYLASWLANGLFGIDFIIATFGSGFVASIVISIVSSIMNGLLGTDSYR